MSEKIKFKVSHGKTSISVSIDSTSTVRDLKSILEQETGVPVLLQKLFLKGPIKNDGVLISSLNLRENSKILLVGSTATEISETSSVRALEEEKKIDLSYDVFTQEQQKIIDKGPPSDCLLADVFNNLRVPETIPGLYNHIGVNVRLAVKLETDELWIVNNSNTKKVPFDAIGDITYVPIVKYPGYNILTLHLGKSNKYNIYFFPHQFIRSLKTLICPFFINTTNSGFK
jgi:Ubiquitin family